MKNLKNLGKALTKQEQKTISGGAPLPSCADIYQNPRNCPTFPIQRCEDWCNYF